MNPTVSILMPVYNASATLGESIESILGQTYTDFELVCVDDGSTDGSGKLIENEGVRDSRIRLIRAKRQGIVSALNRGLKVCTGKYVARMDSDDLMYPERIEQQVRYFQEGGDFDLIGSKVQMISDRGFLSSGVLRYEMWTNSLTEHGDIVREMFVESPIVHPTFFLNKELYDRLGGYRDGPWVEDYDLLLRAHLRNATFGKVPEKLLFWRDSEGRLVRQDKRCKRDAMFRAKVHYFREKGMMGRKRGIVIAGTGPSGKRVARLFDDAAVAITCFVDNHGGPPGREVMGIRSYGFEGPVPTDFFHEFNDSYFIICIGNEAGRADFEAQLEAAGLQWGRDYMRFI